MTTNPYFLKYTSSIVCIRAFSERLFFVTPVDLRAETEALVLMVPASLFYFTSEAYTAGTGQAISMGMSDCMAVKACSEYIANGVQFSK